MKVSSLPHLSQLLPYEPGQKKHGSLKKNLKEYQVVTLALVKACQALEEGYLENFDSLVGENACQIRAVWTAIIFSKKQIDYCSLKEKAIQVLNKIDLLMLPQTINSLMRSTESLKDILEKEDLDICLTSEEMYILQSLILSELKTVAPCEKEMHSLCRIEKITPKKLSQFGDVSYSFADKLIHKLRTLLTSACVQFIRDTANHLEDKALMKMVSEDFTFQRNSLSSLPLFWSTKTVLLAAQKEQIPLIIHAKFLRKGQYCYTVVDEEHLLFKFGSNGSYMATKPNEADLDKAAWVVQGVVAPDKEGELLAKEQWTASMTKRSITDAILAGTADHGQYPDETKDALILDLKDREYEHYKAMAKKEGFSFENPTMFFIQHIYAVRVGNMLNTVSPRGSSQLAYVKL